MKQSLRQSAGVHVRALFALASLVPLASGCGTSSQAPPTSAAPEKLSEYSLFVGNGATQEPVEGVIPYEINTPLFSDYTAKHRFIKLPTGTSATYTRG